MWKYIPLIIVFFLISMMITAEFWMEYGKIIDNVPYYSSHLLDD